MNDGIVFFPHEVELPDNIKLTLIKFGIAGYGIIYRLLERIYSLGYYTPWNDDVCLLFADECRLEPEHIVPVIDYALSKGIFDLNLYKKYGILTSADIQSKFFFAAKNRKEFKINNDYLLIDLNTIFNPERSNGSNVIKSEKKDDLFKSFLQAKENNNCVNFIESRDVFKPWLEQFEAMVIVYAFSICLRKGKNNVDYLFGILGNWKKNGYNYLSDIDDPILSIPDFLKDCPEYLHKEHIDF